MLHQSFTPTMQIAGPPAPQPPVMTNLYQTTQHHIPEYVIPLCHFRVYFSCVPVHSNFLMCFPVGDVFDSHIQYNVHDFLQSPQEGFRHQRV